MLGVFLGYIHTAQQLLWYFTVFLSPVGSLTLTGWNGDKTLSSSICFSSEFLTSSENYKYLNVYKKVSIHFCPPCLSVNSLSPK